MNKKHFAPRPSQRLATLETRRQLKMARSAHAYMRGNTLQFYEWLKTPSAATLPKGPAIWICGDCHLGNLGPVANADGEVELEIRDLDQTVIGNPAHDLIRLGLSLATAARGSDLPGVTTARMVEQMMQGYQDAFHRTGGGSPKGKAAVAIQTLLKRAVRRRWKHLADERIDGVSPEIPLGERFWALTSLEKTEIKQLFDTEAVRKLVTSLQSRKSDAEIRVVDSAYWMKGCSSLGRLRYAVLVKIEKTEEEEGKFCLMDIKEAVPAAAPRYGGTKVFRDHAARVVEGALKLSPYLGERMLAARLHGRPVVVRELMPQDLKLEMETLTVDEAIAAARHLSYTVGRAHARQMNVKTRMQWQATLNRNRPKTLDAPSWLWRSIVELMARHESAYLEHCRTYALRVEHAAEKGHGSTERKGRTYPGA
jgi:uncharacterized protein (DUF2252 family)